ncbi:MULTISPECIES: rhomboid family protein [unclassified Mucilaginibacter]|uniref:rhomboid family protein n=1 Tax=unclassified Mucilaginibacter TaxID=2617802 RepID=UPI000961E772|nr:MULTISPECIES: rhomboid family intramembrane serine protease [unclassified Mucilaginibacter]OJW16503.1 MAG: rhomboid family intramembrane serine protease [Mucilaginibacter sp. 44-25]PLW90576.1 MAG: rhomboid family intramembrane serine protease [Mucilaginibacter sp.]PMP65128.1 MAG: rhomboid family intramembrane serine protease [Mucilaginibacter sp.]HEK21780.1 rhomboid family intramembrane serine protease [Bacteroidota bacterium]
MSTLWQDIQYKMLRSHSRLSLLIGINVIVFLGIYVPATVEQLIRGFGNSAILNFAGQYLVLPASLSALAHHFWTPFTYMFMHAGFFHILFNMLWLYWMGQIFEEYLGHKRTIGLYLMGGLAGGILFVAAYNLIPAFTHVDAASNATIVGASASVMAIIIATATLLPNYTIQLFLLGPVKLKWVAVFYVVIDFIGIAGANAGGEIAHLGGALMGFIYIKQLQRGNDWIGGVIKLFAPKPKLKVVSTNYAPRKAAGVPHQDEIDRILDKISATGYDSLSKQEKESLDSLSKH